MNHGRQGSSAFTIIELLVVIAIIGVLASLLFTVLSKAREKGRQTSCMNNLHQVSLAIALYEIEHQDQFPPWLTSLLPKYMPLGKPEYLICRSDNSKGTQGGKPDSQEYIDLTGDHDQFPETDDINKNNSITNCSYMYEFCAAQVQPIANPWYSGLVYGADGNTLTNGMTWCEVKKCQLKNGDTDHGHKGYDPTLFPVVRCFHHYKERKLDVVKKVNGVMTRTTERLTINVAYDGSVFQAPLTWELLGGN